MPVFNLLQNVRFAFRTLARNPGFAAVVVATLALGIGANTAIFSIVNALLLRPLPYPDSERLVQFYTEIPSIKSDKFWISPPEFFDLAEQATTYECLGAWSTAGAALTGEGTEPVRLPAAYVTSGFLRTLGVEPMPGGRSFTGEDDSPGANSVALISHGVWTRVFGQDRAILGREVGVGGKAFKIIGVMPQGFDFPGNGTELWLPMRLDRANLPGRTAHFLSVIGRLKPSASIEQARAELDTLMDQWASVPTDGHRIRRPTAERSGHPMVVCPLHGEIVGNVGPAMMMLLGAVAFVLLIACANVANLLLARAEARQREIAIRTALGASRITLLSQFLTESLVLGLLGGAAGLLLALWGLDLIVAAAPAGLPRIGEIGIDARVLGFTLTVSLATGALFGLAPFVHTRTAALHTALKSSGLRTSAGSIAQRFRRALVVGEVAVAMVLLVGSGLMLRSLLQLQAVDPGFDPRGVLTFQVELVDTRYKDQAAVLGFWARLREELAVLPGVRSASLTSQVPASAGLTARDTEIENYNAENDTRMPPENIDYWHFVGPDYFATMGIRLAEPQRPDWARGRLLNVTDTLTSAPVALINEATARRFFPDQDPIGRRVRDPGGSTPWMTIVGVVRDIKQQGMERPAGTDLYIPLQQPGSTAFGVPRFMTMAIKTEGNPRSLLPVVRDLVRRLDAQIPVANARTMQEVVWASTGRVRLIASLLGVFAVIAVLLAAVGIYGVMSYSVARRTNEIGIRMALGARATSVMAMILCQGLAVTMSGVLIGVLAALALTRLLGDALEAGAARQVAAGMSDGGGMLFGVHPMDPITFVGVAAVLIGVATLASYIPARRATRVDPMIALRTE